MTIKDLRNAKKAKHKLTLDSQGNIKDYPGINFEKTQEKKKVNSDTDHQ